MAWLAAKECKNCGRWHSSAAGFYRHPRNRDRRQGVCIACYKFEAAELRKVKIDERRAYDRERYKSMKRRRDACKASAAESKRRVAFERAVSAIVDTDACVE